METIIIKPKDQSELNLFLELAKKLGTKFLTIESDADERLFQRMEENKRTPIVSRENMMNTLHKLIED